MKIQSNVFERSGSSLMTGSTFLALISFFIMCGLALTAVCAQHAAAIGYQPGFGGVILLGIALPLVGVLMSVNTENPVVGLFGYALIAAPFGFLLGPVVNKYSPNVLRDVTGMTAGITAVMGAAGMFFPRVFSKLGGALLVSLSGLVIMRIVALFVPAWNFGWLDYAGAGIFSLYIGYDMYRATEVPRTAGNAVNIAVSLYLDVLNLFLTLLNIKSRD